MVEYVIDLDSVFNSLADQTRRDILRRISDKDLSISEIAKPYELSFAAVAKHLNVLERAKLIIKRRRGKERIVSIAPRALADASQYIEIYRQMWEKRLDSLDTYLSGNGLK